MKHKFRLKPRHKWFCTDDKDTDGGWFGPHKTIEEAVIAIVCNYYSGDRVFVAQGYKMNKAEREESCHDFDWEVDAKNIFEIIPPK